MMRVVGLVFGFVWGGWSFSKMLLSMYCWLVVSVSSSRVLVKVLFGSMSVIRLRFVMLSCLSICLR